MKRFSFFSFSAPQLRKNTVFVIALIQFVLSLTIASAQERGSLTGSLRLVSTASTLTGMLGGVQMRFVSTTDASVITTLTNPDGVFSLSNVTIGTYTLAPVQDGAVFFPVSTTVTITTSDIAQVSFDFVPPLPRITGQVIGATTALPFPFALVNVIGGGTRLTASVNALGRFNIPVSTAGTYTVTPTTSSLRAAFAITPRVASSQVDANGTVQGLPTFLAFLPQYRLQGVVRTLAGEGISGNTAIRIEELGPNGIVVNTLATTAIVSVSGGEFVMSVTNGTYRVTVSYGSLSPVTITPNPQIIGVTDANVNMGTITITNRRYQIRGRVITTNGALVIPLAQILVRIEQFGTNQSIGNAVTDANGNFTLLVDASRFTGVPLRLFITLNGFTFTNKGVAFDNVLALEGLRDDLQMGDINAIRIPDRQFPVNGSVLYPNRQPVQVPIIAIVTNANSVQLTTREIPLTVSADGRYTIAGVTSGVFRISLRAQNLVFSPSQFDIVMPRDVGAEFNFEATMSPITINGQVQTVLGEPVFGVQMRVNGSPNTPPTTTDALGRYSLQVSGQYPGSRWFVFPTQQGSTFYPPNRLVVSSLIQPALGAMDFRATSTTNTLPLSTINGKITVFSNDGRERGLGGVLVSDGTRTATSDVNGNYTLRNIPNGSYTLTPVLDGYVFTPNTLQASILGGNTTQNQNFVSRLRTDTTNLPPFIQTPINDIPIIAAATTQIPLTSVFVDANNDSLSITTTVEDPTLLRTRIRTNMLMLDGLSEGNTMVSVIANDNRGGTTTASFRVFVSRPFSTPRIFVRPRGNVNTNINAAIVIDPQAVLAAAGLLPMPSEKGTASLTSLSGELGAFNSKCECVGSIVWNAGNSAVLPVWGEDEESEVPGMKFSEPIHIRFVDNIERRSRRTRAMYLYNVPPGLWPIDQAIATNILVEGQDDPCQPVQNVVMSAQTDLQALGVSVTPNPVASGKALISYTLPSAGMVNIELWNILGQRVSTLANGYQASGEQRVDFNVEDLPTGMYICRIQSSSEGSSGTRNVATVRLSVIR